VQFVTHKPGNSLGSYNMHRLLSSLILSNCFSNILNLHSTAHSVNLFRTSRKARPVIATMAKISNKNVKIPHKNTRSTHYEYQVPTNT
jgi:hypothetical protein